MITEQEARETGEELQRQERSRQTEEITNEEVNKEILAQARSLYSDLVAARRLLRLAVVALKATGTHTGTVQCIEEWLKK